MAYDGDGVSVGGTGSVTAATGSTGAEISAAVSTTVSTSGTVSVATAVSPSPAGFAAAGFCFTGFGNGFFAVSMRPSANSSTAP
ncbi:MAG: hypothetical protein WDN00_12135 [Limisphaerales bacterium]